MCKKVKINDLLKNYTTSCPIKTTTSSKNDSNFSLGTSFSKKNMFLKNKELAFHKSYDLNTKKHFSVVSVNL